YVTGTGAAEGATASGGRSGCLSSRRCPQSFLSEPASSACGTLPKAGAFADLLNEVFALVNHRACCTDSPRGGWRGLQVVLSGTPSCLRFRRSVLDRHQPRSYARYTLSTFAGSGSGARRHDVFPLPAGESSRGAHFCMKCGAGLKLACAKCNTELPRGAAFCFACRQPVAAAPGQPLLTSPAVYTPRHLAEKILTSKKCVGARAETGDGAVRRSQGLHGVAGAAR